MLSIMTIIVFILSASFKEIPIRRSPPPSRGVPWPLPRQFTSAADVVFLFADQMFSFVLSEQSVTCDLIEKAVDRSYRSIFTKRGKRLQKITPSHPFLSTTRQGTFLRQLEIHVGTPCAVYPSLEANESCTY